MGEKSFNTPHVTLYRLEKYIQRESTSSFNTSHVTLYRYSVCALADSSQVSIHHMLLFIIVGERIPNYPGHVSIHHMLLFIWSPRPLAEVYIRFQYITCYSLSTGKKLASLKEDCFNTSHVTLYRRPIGS